ncbi:hypothetical protein AB6887_02335 [Carnobacterium divergens]|uniref:Uncharacterized protein n=1 Tax=Carnobacterium divergens TaxID=2748 RepID=A0A7Z8CZ16_CARDV|nr:hypothetical protein [Carnobacterium divergens]TFI73585.1 hypothetical protein CKN58_06320 [Carnobacterium divergens]TFI77532.1 hypothetical protein CKN85_06315 [Carnobacterium divergens]TFI84295.1 hypothetical protein CKN56_06355 [Carnobacterium divergens]TFI96142.1 hypothetical protein CKN64_06295 [Carnobacterium divergens]TFJ12445.1 hypothetical protein CKN60_06360 [Carnobacterium divergens]
MADGKDESGYVLLYALGAIVLISILIGGIFLVARTIFFQVDKVDQFKRVKEVEEYALQDGTTQIQKEIELYLAGLETIDFGNDVSIISRDIDTLFASFERYESGIGSNKQFSYKTTINKISKEKITPYVLTTLNGSYGWEKDTSMMNSTKATNAELTFEIKTEVSEQQKGGDSKTSIAKASYVYEIQWNDIDIADELNELDVWRNVVYSYYLPNSAGYLSADEWMRKMNILYRFNNTQSVFNFTDYDNTTSYVEGYSNGHIIDITDGKVLNFTSTGKAIRSTLTFEGSLLFENGIALEGSTSSSKLVVNNLFSLRRNNASSKNSIQTLDIVANNGTYIDFAGQEGYLAIDEQDASFSTSGLLINHTPTVGSIENGGVVFGSGQLAVQTQPDTHNFSFANYSSSASSKSPKDSYWNEFVKGSAVIASSNFYAGPLNISTDIQSTEDDFRQINIDGNFLLTNAMLDSEKGEEGFSYFQDSAINIPNSPSTLSLDGRNTRFQVAGKSFIDAPKTERRKSLTETTENVTKFYGDKKDWNSITLKNGAVMDLGYVGIEPFTLSISEDSIFSAKVLPELAFFDTSFLANSVSEGTLKGKVILQTFNQKDADDLKAELESQKIPVSVVTENEKAENAEVTIVKPSNSAGSGTSQIISRTFNYLNEINY